MQELLLQLNAYLIILNFNILLFFYLLFFLLSSTIIDRVRGNKDVLHHHYIMQFIKITQLLNIFMYLLQAVCCRYVLGDTILLKLTEGNTHSAHLSSPSPPPPPPPFTHPLTHSPTLTHSVVVCEGRGEARVRGQVRRGGDRGGVPLGFFLGAGASGFVFLVQKKIWDG